MYKQDEYATIAVRFLHNMSIFGLMEYMRHISINTVIKVLSLAIVMRKITSIESLISITRLFKSKNSMQKFIDISTMMGSYQSFFFILKVVFTFISDIAKKIFGLKNDNIMRMVYILMIGSLTIKYKETTENQKQKVRLYIG